MTHQIYRVAIISLHVEGLIPLHVKLFYPISGSVNPITYIPIRPIIPATKQ